VTHNQDLAISTFFDLIDVILGFDFNQRAHWQIVQSHASFHLRLENGAINGAVEVRKRPEKVTVGRYSHHPLSFPTPGEAYRLPDAPGS
jgi:hypothetical protein